MAPATWRRFAASSRQALHREGSGGDVSAPQRPGVRVRAAAIRWPSRSVATLEAGALVGRLSLLDRSLRLGDGDTAIAGSTAFEAQASVFGNTSSRVVSLALRFQREVATAAARHLRRANALRVLIDLSLPDEDGCTLLNSLCALSASWSARFR